MRGYLLYVVLPLAAAAASVLNLIHFWLDNIVDPVVPPLVTASWYVAFLVVVGALVLGARAMDRRRAWLLVLAVVIIIGAGFAPRVLNMGLAMQKQAADQAAGAEAEMEFQMAYLDESDKVAERIAAKEPLTAEEGLALLEFAADADLTWRSLPDHTKETFALVAEALDAGILDPDALTTAAPVADSPAVTLTLLFYEKHIRPVSPEAIKKKDWALLQMLLIHNADLSSPDAAPLVADLAKTAVPGAGRFITLE